MSKSPAKQNDKARKRMAKEAIAIAIDAQFSDIRRRLDALEYRGTWRALRAQERERAIRPLTPGPNNASNRNVE